MRILYDGVAFQEGMLGGGVNRYARELISRIAAIEGTDVSVYGSLAHWPEGRTLAIREMWEPRVRENHRFCAAAKRINSIVESALGPTLPLRTIGGQPDLFHLPYYRMPAKVGAIVVTVYDMLLELFREQYDNSYCESIRRQKKRAVEAAAHVFCISESARQDVMRMFDVPAGRISVTYLASDLSMAPPREDGAGAAQPIPDEPFLLHVGSRYFHKNFAGFLQAYGQWELRREVRLVNVGGPEWSESEVGAMRKLGIEQRVVRWGRATDATLATLYRRAMAAVCPSLYEGFGLPVLEALQCGGVVCSSNRSSLPEVGGDVAIYFDPEQPESIIRALSGAAGLGPADRRQRSQRGIDWAKNFSWDRTAQETMQVYRQLVGEALPLAGSADK
jgi:glycosyltransferase involved in cell wall biosynthesis